MKYCYTLIFMIVLSGPVKQKCLGCAHRKKINPDTLVRPDLKKIYDEYNVDGMFVLYDLKTKKHIFYNPAFYRQPMSPASTFNILLTLIALQEGVVKDEKALLKPYNIPLERAFKNNVDSCFIDLSLLIGEKKIKYWLDKINYGNKSTSGENNRFWINGYLQVTAEQQLDFIEKFYYEKLPFSKQAYKVVKKLMHEDEFKELAVYGKRGSNKLYWRDKYTGKLYNEDKYTGWFVGYIETTNSTYFFTNYIESPDLNHPKLVSAQKEIAFKIIKALNIK